MDVNEFLGWLTDGLDDAEKAVVTKAVQRDAVKAKAAGLKQQSEFDRIMSERQALQAELEGDQAAGKVGARQTRDWYEKNVAAIVANDKAIKAFNDKWGADAFTKAAAGELPAVTPPVNTGTGTLTEAQVQALVDARIKSGVSPAVAEADIQRLVDKRIAEGYAPKWGELVTGAGKIVLKHISAQRKTPLDFDAVTKLATEKTNGNLEAAYDEWDKPEREKVQQEARANEIKAAVAAERAKWDEERKQQNASRLINGGADATPSALSVHKGAEGFDRSALLRSMALDVQSAELTN